MRVEGETGSVEMQGDAVILSRKVLFQGGHEQRIMKLSELSAVEFKQASGLGLGYIRFIYPGAPRDGGTLLPSMDRNVVMFRKDQEPIFRDLHKSIMRAILDDATFEPAEQQVLSNSMQMWIQLSAAAIGLYFLWWIASS